MSLPWGVGGGRCCGLSSLLSMLWRRHWGAWSKEGAGTLDLQEQSSLSLDFLFPAFSRWTAEDLAFIRLSINSFLDQLSRVIRNTQRHWLPPRQSLGWGKGLRPNLVFPTRQGIHNSNYATLLSSNRHFVMWVYVFACTGLWYLLGHLLCFPAAWGVGYFSVYSAENKSKLLFCVSGSFQLMCFWIKKKNFRFLY